jgi:BirA family biotin operon repressor/biotin-[acetyl-CoA-carboxylase] ligase
MSRRDRVEGVLIALRPCSCLRSATSPSPISGAAANNAAGAPCLIRTVAEIGSTNDDVAALAREGAPEGLWLRAERQTGGRGRQGRGLALARRESLCEHAGSARTRDPPAPSLAMVAAVALHEVVSAFAPGIRR